MRRSRYACCRQRDQQCRAQRRREPSTCTALLSVWRPLFRLGRWRFRRDGSGVMGAPADRPNSFPGRKDAEAARGFAGPLDSDSNALAGQIRGAGVEQGSRGLGRFWDGSTVRHRSMMMTTEARTLRRRGNPHFAQSRTVAHCRARPRHSWHSRGRGFDSLRLHFAIRVVSTLTTQLRTPGTLHYGCCVAVRSRSGVTIAAAPRC